MKTVYRNLLVSMVLVLLFASCSIPKAETPTRVFPTETLYPSKTATFVPTATPTLTPSPTIMPTPTAIVDKNPDLSVVYYYPNQLTDGTLMLSIEEDDASCHHPGDVIPLKLTYKNLTRNPLVLVDYNFLTEVPALSNGLLYTILISDNEEVVHSRGSYLQAEFFNPDSPLLQLIAPKGSFDFIGMYLLPKEIGIEDNNQYVTFQPLPPDRYLFKLVYVVYEYQDAWHGKISSNQIQICVME